MYTSLLKSLFITPPSLRNLIIGGCILRELSSLLVVRILLLLFWLSPLAQCYLPKVKHSLLYQATTFLMVSCPPLLLPMLHSLFDWFVCHLFLCCRVGKYSNNYLFQNCLIIATTCFHFLRLDSSPSPKWFGVKAWKSSGLSLTWVRGRLFTIA